MSNFAALLAAMPVASSAAPAAPPPPVQVRSLARDLAEAIDRFLETHGQRSLGMCTGLLPTLDKRTNGLRGMVVLAGPGGIGKTALALQMGISVVHTNDNACFAMFSFDMNMEDVHRRCVATAAGVSWRDLVLGAPKGSKLAPADDGLRFTEGQRRRYVEGVDRLRRLSDRICLTDCATLKGVTPEWIGQTVEALRVKSKTKRAYVVIDSLDALAARVPGATHEDRVRLTLEQLAAPLRSRRDDAYLLITDDQSLSGSLGGRLRSACDCLLTMGDPPEGEQDTGSERQILLTVAKARDGASRGSVPLRFLYDRVLFMESNRAAAASSATASPAAEPDSPSPETLATEARAEA